MGDKMSPMERLAYFQQFEDEFSGTIDFGQYIDVRQSHMPTL